MFMGMFVTFVAVKSDDKLLRKKKIIIKINILKQFEYKKTKENFRIKFGFVVRVPAHVRGMTIK